MESEYAGGVRANAKSYSSRSQQKSPTERSWIFTWKTLPYTAVLLIVVVEFCNPCDGKARSTEFGGALFKEDAIICLGAFVTPSFLVTSCRCLGRTNYETGGFTKSRPVDYEIRSWGRDKHQKKRVKQFHYHYHCALETNRVLMDLGLAESATPFRSSYVTPVDFPSLSGILTHKFINQLVKEETICESINYHQRGGRFQVAMLPTLFEFCHYKGTCFERPEVDCYLSTWSVSHFCGINVANNEDISMFIGGAPVVCYGMLVGINGGDFWNNSIFNPQLFIRMDLSMPWIKSIVCKK